MPIDPDALLTGGALQGALAASLLRQRDQTTALMPGARVGAYRIERELGRGGMAIVYLAARDDGEYEQRVALKWMLQARPDDAGATLFRRERQALADLQHPHIARLVDGGRTPDGRPWLAMEYIDGAPIDRHCAQHALPLRARLAAFLQVCAAVAFAHARGVLRRDIKPSNVLVDADGAVRLLDFGIAQILGQDDTPAPRAYTPGFASPEQVRGDTLTVASDVFQLGRLLQAVLDADTRDAAATPSSAAWPHDIRAIVTCATAPDVATRYATVDALAQDVRAYLSTRPVAARARRPAYLASRYLRRHGVAATAVGVAAVLLLVGAIAFVWQLRIERDTANYQARVATSVLDFLRQDLLSAADPGAAPGHELSVREALDLASASAATRFRDLPAEEGAIRTTLADLYHQLGRYDDAEREGERALALAQQPGTHADQLAAARHTLAGALQARGDGDAAAPLLAQVLQHIEATQPAQSREWIALRTEQATARHDAGDYDAAATALQSLHALASARYSPDDPLVLDLGGRLVDALTMLGRHAQALELAEPMHALWRDRVGELHPRTLTAAQITGTLHRHLGQPELALAWIERAIAGRRNVLGDDHPETLLSLNEQATILQMLGRHAEAEPLFVHVLQARERLLGETHPRTRNSMSNLGLLYAAWDKPDQAAPLYERTLALDRESGNADHPDSIALMHNIAGLYRRQGRFDAALAMHAAAVDSGRRVLGEDSWQLAMFLTGQAQTLAAAGRADEAVRVMDDAVARFDRMLGPDHASSAKARAIRAGLIPAAAAPASAGSGPIASPAAARDGDRSPP